MNTDAEIPPSINVICIKWGTYYPADYVNRLFRAVKRNFVRYEPTFICFTDFSEGLDPEIVVQPLPELKNAQGIYLKEAGLCDDNLGGLQGQRVLFFDLDSVITGELDCFVDMMQSDQPYITKDYGKDSEVIGGSNIYSWVVGSLGYIKEFYENNTDDVLARFGTASQEYWSAKVIERYGKLNLFPDQWHWSFKKHCMPRWPASLFQDAQRPGPDVRLVNFHGDPKIHDALAGTWSSRRHFPVYKKIYKYTRPVKWVNEFWK